MYDMCSKVTRTRLARWESTGPLRCSIGLRMMAVSPNLTLCSGRKTLRSGYSNDSRSQEKTPELLSLLIVHVKLAAHPMLCTREATRNQRCPFDSRLVLGSHIG